MKVAADPSPYVTMALIVPGVLSVFSLAFLWAWSIERKRHYLLLQAAACGLFALGAFSQILGLPPDIGHNAIVSGMIYTLAVLAGAEGMVRRSGKTMGPVLHVVVFVGVTVLLWYFFYVSRNLWARVYVQNFGYGAVLLIAALKLRPLARGRRIDRLLFWFLFLFALQFFLRTALTAGGVAPKTPRAFADTPFWQSLQLSLAVFATGLAVTILAAALTDIMDDLRRERDTDALTGVLNRRGFEQRAAALMGSAAATPFTLVCCDLDHFKSINDTYGHHAGDEVLERFGALLRGNVRSGDLVGRMGGEEFVVLLPGAARADAMAFCRRVQQRLEATEFPSLAKRRRVTASFGTAEREGGETLEAMLLKADRRLYSAKAAGRNCIVATDDAADPEGNGGLLLSGSMSR